MLRATSTQSVLERSLSSASSDQQHDVQALIVGDALHDGREAQEAVGDVKRDHAVGLHVPQVDGERLARDEVHRVSSRSRRRRSPARRTAAAARAPSRAARRPARSRSVALLSLRIGELAPRDVDDLRIDLVEAVDVARAAVDRERAGAEPHHADPARRRAECS